MKCNAPYKIGDRTEPLTIMGTLLAGGIGVAMTKKTVKKLFLRN